MKKVICYIIELVTIFAFVLLAIGCVDGVVTMLALFATVAICIACEYISDHKFTMNVESEDDEE